MTLFVLSGVSSFAFCTCRSGVECRLRFAGGKPPSVDRRTMGVSPVDEDDEASWLSVGPGSEKRTLFLPRGSLVCLESEVRWDSAFFCWVEAVARGSPRLLRRSRRRAIGRSSTWLMLCELLFWLISSVLLVLLLSGEIFLGGLNIKSKGLPRLLAREDPNSNTPDMWARGLFLHKGNRASVVRD